MVSPTSSNREALKDAVNELIVSPKAHEMFDALTVLVPLAINNYPVKLSGDASILNPLIALKKSNPVGYQNVIELIEKRRADRGFDRLTKEDNDGAYNKVEYMRAFMDQKRVRERRAADIENTLRPDREKLRGAARLEFMRRQSAVWKDQRDRFVESARGPNGAPLSRETLKAVLSKFWAAVDAELDEREARAKEEVQKPAHQRQRPDVSMDALLQALENDPYASQN